MPRTKEEIHAIVEKQRAFFRTGKTLDVSWRIEQLKKLRGALVTYEHEIEEALHEDLGRSVAEAYFCDIGDVILETNEMIHGLRRWARPELHFSGFTCFPSLITRVHKMPYGVALIISPFNFPILLSLGVLAASIAGGNTAVIKASSKSAACTAVLQKVIAETFPEEYCTVID
ncbi:MAG: aldehyde dehydrogenase family protein, partial [Clostridia bacterium]|nr:aldehyde dehydrogenase family protein [Clostridia bacterium]